MAGERCVVGAAGNSLSIAFAWMSSGNGKCCAALFVVFVLVDAVVVDSVVVVTTVSSSSPTGFAASNPWMRSKNICALSDPTNTGGHDAWSAEEAACDDHDASDGDGGEFKVTSSSNARDALRSPSNALFGDV